VVSKVAHQRQHDSMKSLILFCKRQIYPDRRKPRLQPWMNAVMVGMSYLQPWMNAVMVGMSYH